MEHVFGPVTTRRLGRSLGIDPVPSKACTWDCVYCQLGRTRRFARTRKSFFPVSGVLKEVQQALDRTPSGSIDHVTFVGSGETTLHADLGSMIRGVRRLTSIPIAVITNGSLLFDPDLRSELAASDIVLPSLDAGSACLFRTVNRPRADLDFERHVAGLVAFRQEFAGRIWLEVMLIDGLNDRTEALEELASAVKSIAPDEIHVLRPTRPAAEAWVRPAADAAVASALAIFGRVAPTRAPDLVVFDAPADGPLADVLRSIVARHPLREDEVAAWLGRRDPEHAAWLLESLRKSGRFQVVGSAGTRYWTVPGGVYGIPAT